MNANELAEIQAFKTEELTMWERNHTATMLRQQQAEIETYKLELYDEVMLRREQKAEIEALKENIEKLKDAYCQKDHEVKKAKYGITTKWDGRTTYHETIEPIEKAQEK
jgi:hypothetical protein